MKHPAIVALGLTVLLAACAINSNASYVASNDALDNAVMARATADYLHSQMPAAQSTLTIEPVSDGDASLLTFLSDDLRELGFAVAAPGSGAPGVQDVRLLVAPQPPGFTVRIDYGGRQAATFFNRDTAGALRASSSFVLRSVNQ